VVRYAYVPYLSLLHGLLHGFIQARAVAGKGTEIRIMELIQVYVVSLQRFQGCMQVLPESFCRFCHGLRGDIHLVAPVCKGGTQLFFAVRIGPGCIVVIDAPVKCTVE